MPPPTNPMSESPPHHIRERSSVGQEDTSSTKFRDHFDYLNYPNELEAIPDADFNTDRLNLFIAFDQKHNKLSVEDRAFPLLRPSPPTIPHPKPGFISFLGETGSGKSWILRSLKRREDRARYPLPLVTPGRDLNNFMSTSADVNLYADSATSESSHPILFLDFEGLEGSQPSSLKARFGNGNPLSNEVESLRYAFIRDAYPRIAYAFSNCIIFVIHRQPGKAEDAAELLTLYSNGSRQLGFKPALFLVFNKMRNSGFSPSIEESTRRFLAMEGVTRIGLIDHYHKISVIHIPELTLESSKLVIAQLDKLERLLREQHSEACNRRVAVRLDFTADQIIAYLTQALRVFTNRNDAVFDWLEQSLDQRELPDSTKVMWNHFYRHFRRSGDLSPIKAFESALKAFHSHFVFCVRLHLARHPLVGRAIGSIPNVFKNTIRDVSLAIRRYVPCGGAKDGLECDRINDNHDHDSHTCGSKRWRGTFNPAVQCHSLEEKVSKSLAASGSQDWPKLSVRDSESISILSKIRSVYSCVGCLNHPSTFLSCQHGFCEDCVEDIAMTKDLHRLVNIKCPFCQPTSKEDFSPRFLPRAAGYRVLSLDGGGARSLAQIMILRAIETQCFDIPIAHLFDFFIGTNIGGQLILAMTSRESPLLLSNAATELTNLVSERFRPKKSLKSSIWNLFRAAMQGSTTKYSATALDASLKEFFDESPRLLSARTPPSPHVAVATVSHTNTKRVIPNYTRRASGDPDEDKRRLVLSDNPQQCMPTWVAARCTAAVYPYFKGFDWEGEYFLDEGSSVSCPAQLAVDETRRLWPGRRMDILVSVGTGATGRLHDNQSQDGHSKLSETSSRAVTNPDKLWADFTSQHASEMKRISRLQPVYSGTLPLDAVSKIEAISKEIGAWLKTNAGEIKTISNQLVASLFFFRPSTLDGQSGTQSGSIECRLPPDLFERQAMVNALIKVSHTRQLFTFDISGRGRSRELIKGVVGCLEDLFHGAELSIQVTFDRLPLVGGTTIDIKLCDLFGNGEFRYSISGCPFPIRN